jgi:hypothetical protein
MGGVSQHLEQAHGIRVRPGGKAVCPFCRHNTFAVKRDDSVAKCFHPSCRQYITQGSFGGGYTGSLWQVLDRIKDDFHQHLQAQRATGARGGAWEFLTEQRGVHPRVITDLAELGAVAPGYDVAGAFQPALDAIDARARELNAKIEESLKRRLIEGQAGDRTAGKRQAPVSAKSKTEYEKGWENELIRLRASRQALEEKCSALKDLFGRAASWIAFFHTDHLHRVRSVRFRQPFDKRFVSFVVTTDHTGLFGHGLFQPYSEANRPGNRLIIVEGELNLLAVHSLAVRLARPGDEGGSYANWVGATGSSSTLDVGTIRELMGAPGAVPPVVVRRCERQGGRSRHELHNDVCRRQVDGLVQSRVPRPVAAAGPCRRRRPGVATGPGPPQKR